MCAEYKESNNNKIMSSAEKVVRPWPDRPDRRLRPCLKEMLQKTKSNNKNNKIHICTDN